MTRSRSKERPAPTPKTANPWDMPLLPAKGDASSKTTFEWVGRALSQWEYFEAYFGLLFGTFVGATEPFEPALRAYGSILTFRGRSEMIKAASIAHFVRYQDDLIGPFKELSKQFASFLTEADNFASRRNEIAHGIVQPYFPDGQREDGYALGPSRHATNKRKLTPKEGPFLFRIAPVYAYTSVELEKFADHFERLARRTLNLQRDVIQSRGLRKATTGK